MTAEASRVASRNDASSEGRPLTGLAIAACALSVSAAQGPGSSRAHRAFECYWLAVEQRPVELLRGEHFPPLGISIRTHNRRPSVVRRLPKY